METRKMKLALSAGALALSIALAGCGGGGSSGSPQGNTALPAPTPPAPEPEPTPDPTVTAVTIPDAMYLNEDNMPMAGAPMTIMAGDSYTNNGVMFSCPADGDACEVEVMADGSVTSTGGEAKAELTSDAMVQVAQAKKAAADKMKAELLENRDRIIGKDRALEAAANIGTGGSPAESAISISRAPGKAAKVGSTGYSEAKDAALPNGDWAGTRLMQSVAGATRHLFVYTDIEAPTRIQFYNWDGDAMTPSLYADTVTDALTGGDAADSSTTITPLGLGGDGQTFSASVADLTRFPAAPSPEEGSKTQTYQVNEDTDNNNTNDRVSIPGNFNGAGGRYLCTPASGTSCSVTVAPSGAYTSSDTWTFLPELNSTAWLQDGGTAAGAGGGQIGDFMSFGWWLQEPTAPTGVYTFRYYANGTPYQLDSGNLSRGSATYNGRAAGKFVVQELDDTGVIDGEAGMFTAAASLTAKFNGTAAGGTLEGAINGFQTDNGNVDVSGWMVTLNRQTLTGDANADVTSAGTNNDPGSSGFDGATAMMGDQKAHGTWDSQFFGLPANVGGSADAYPLGVGGTFQADSEAASIAGAFGARR